MTNRKGQVTVAYLSISAFAADYMQMKKDIEKVIKVGADFLHVDIMDGHFVPSIGLNIPLINSIHKNFRIPLDIHFMTYNTASFVERFLGLDINSILFHVEEESEKEIFRVIEMVKSRGISCGLAISPETELSLLKKYIPEVDEFLLMCTNPGLENSIFQTEAYERIRELSMMIKDNKKIVLSVDGGINRIIAGKCLESGADKIIMGRAFFQSDSPEEIARESHSYKK